MIVKYPNIQVELVGHDGNALNILGRVTKALRQHNVDDADVKAFMSETTSGDYDHLLQTVIRWVNAT